MTFTPFLSWLGLGLFALSVSAIILASSAIGRARLARKRAAFGPRTGHLLTEQPPARRAAKRTLLVLALVCLFAALARPQGGVGKKHWVQTTLDVVIVLDYSKSMYARDIPPSRIDRAKIEVADLIRKLPGARFAAIAFAGEPMSFPLSSDGNAVAQFFRQLSPVDMPVGGTATAKALERARELLKRDSQEHDRVIVLVTDGEDLEGDPVRVAEQCAQEGNQIHVVQIGTSAPEMLPEMDEQGNVVGTRRDNRGRPITTSLSADGEAQLQKLAQVTGGTLTRANKGKTGISELATMLQKRGRAGKREEVVTGLDEWFAVPLGIAVLLLLLELLLSERKARHAA